jgi:crotonobetainyl-CoA:carnitine CoA-transferase CaiB-like acyl-CoA transferase
MTTEGFDPLGGVRVLELANFAAAPSAAAIMADLGADVVKVEPPGGDPMWGAMRQARLPDGATNPDHPMQFVNRGKRSVAVDLGTDDGRDIVRRLAAASDVVVMNLLPARRRRFGLTAAELLALRSDLVVATLTGYGEEGDEVDRPGFDTTAYFARSGTASLLPGPDGGPGRFRQAQGDHVAGLALFAGIMTALRARDLTGHGQVVEASLLRTATWTLGFDLSIALADGRAPSIRGRTEAISPIAEAYRCADGRWIQFAVVDARRGWAPFCTAIGEPELIDHPDFATPELRFENMVAIVERLDATFARRTRAVWGEILDEHGIVWAPVSTLDEVVADPQVRATGAFAPVEHPEAGTVELVAAPFRLHTAESRPRAGYVGRGHETDDVLRDVLALDDDELARLRASGTVGPAAD